MKRLLLLLGLFACSPAWAAEVIPPVPQNHFNDYANAVSKATAGELNRTLEDFERATSSQVLVAVYPKMQSNSAIEDYTVRVAQSWGAGRKGKDNGAVLFVFIQDHKMYLQVGYGLEGSLPDALCKSIIENEIKPHFKAGDFDRGLRAGVAAILAATRGEYRGTGQTAAESKPAKGFELSPHIVPWIFICVIVLFPLFLRATGTGYSNGGRRRYYGGGWIGGGGGWSSGAGFSGGGGGGGGGGSFSSGGGSFGGGGAGGSW